MEQADDEIRFLGLLYLGNPFVGRCLKFLEPEVLVGDRSEPFAHVWCDQSQDSHLEAASFQYGIRREHWLVGAYVNGIGTDQWGIEPTRHPVLVNLLAKLDVVLADYESVIANEVGSSPYDMLFSVSHIIIIIRAWLSLCHITGIEHYHLLTLLAQLVNVCEDIGLTDFGRRILKEVERQNHAVNVGSEEYRQVAFFWFGARGQGYQSDQNCINQFLHIRIGFEPD